VTLRRTAVALVAFGLAAALALLARDVWRWQDALGSGDVQSQVRLVSTSVWRPSETIPFHLGRGLLGVEDDLAMRQALELYLQDANRTDSGVAEQQARGRAEAALAAVERGLDPLRASQAATLLGIMAFTDVSRAVPGQPSSVSRSYDEFVNAIRLDPRNDAAKFDLELLLQIRKIPGIGRLNANGAGAAITGKGGGAGIGPPGRGY
jgi:hypothetical protein